MKSTVSVPTRTSVAAPRPTAMFQSRPFGLPQLPHDVVKTAAAHARGRVARGAQERVSTLPSHLKKDVEQRSGIAMDDVRVHYNSGKPSEMQALAYAQGSEIHLAPEQEQHLAHEAWHVVQQKQGRVPPTRHVHGVAINDAHHLEREADTHRGNIARTAIVSPLKLSDRNMGGAVVQRRITNWIDTGPLKALGTTEPSVGYQLGQLITWTQQLRHSVRNYNRINAASNFSQARTALRNIVDLMLFIMGGVDTVIPWLSSTQNQSAADKATYRAVVRFQSQFTRLSREVNTEVATFLNITRAGPGGRPDANAEASLSPTTVSSSLGLTVGERHFLAGFVEHQGGTWKESREGLSAIWARRGGLFQNLVPGKGNQYGADVEYRTTDAGKPELWDQKTIYFAETGFDGRISHTHTKAEDQEGHHVGILIDATFVRASNYERAWLQINEQLLAGKVAPYAVKEVVAPHPDQLRAGIYVDMTQQYSSTNDPDSVKRNVKWAEAKVSGTINQFASIPLNALVATNLVKILSNHPDERSHSRYTNNRDWLPSGVYDEFAVKGDGPPNSGKARFVISEDRRAVYLTVTHYKGATVFRDGAETHRNPFYLVRRP